MDHHSVIQEVPMLRTEKQYDDEPVVDSNLRRQLTRRTRSTVSSISIPIDTSQLDPSCERETNHIVGGRPLSATPGTGNRFLMQQIRDETGNEVVVEIDGNQNNNNHNNHDSINEHLQKAGPRGMCNDPYCTTCPTYFQGSQQTNPKASSTFTDSKVKNSSGDGKGFGRKLFSFCSSCVPEVMNPHAKVVQRWNQILAIFCLVAIFVDPLFLFVIYVKKDDKCIAINWAMAKTLVLLRSINDFVYFLNMLLQFRLAYVSPKSRVVLDDRPKEIALHYLKGHFIFDFLLVLPLPQIIIVFVLPRSLGSSGANYGKNLLRLVILIQYLPRLFKFLPLVVGLSPTGSIFESAWANVVINLLIFMLSGHVVGSCWYLFGLQRVNRCLRDACHQDNYNRTICKDLIDCDPNVPNISSSLWSNNKSAIACLNSTSGAFSYGIYANAVPLTTETNVVNRYVFALFWGFQQISTLAGNQTPSNFVGEALFTMAIIGLGLLLFAFLIGNVQNFLQGLGRRRLDMQLKCHDVEQWMSHHRLPEKLRTRVRQAERFNWAATRGVPEETILENLPEDLQTDIRRHLFRFVKEVQIFSLMDEPLLEAIYKRLKQKTYIKGSSIFTKGVM